MKTSFSSSVNLKSNVSGDLFWGCVTHSFIWPVRLWPKWIDVTRQRIIKQNVPPLQRIQWKSASKCVELMSQIHASVDNRHAQQSSIRGFTMTMIRWSGWLLPVNNRQNHRDRIRLLWAFTDKRGNLRLSYRSPQHDVDARCRYCVLCDQMKMPSE